MIITKKTHISIFFATVFIMCFVLIPTPKASAQLVPSTNISVPTLLVPTLPAPASGQTANTIGSLQNIITPPAPSIPPPVTIIVSTSSSPSSTNSPTTENQPTTPATSPSDQANIDPSASTTNESNAENATTSTSTAIETVKSTTTPSVYSSIKNVAATAEADSAASVSRWVNNHFFPSSDYQTIGFSRVTTMFFSILGIILIALGSVFSLGYIELIVSSIKKGTYTSHQL